MVTKLSAPKAPTYDIAKIPEAGSQIVLGEKAAVLNNIDLEGLTENLGLVADLIFVAYCGVGEYADLRGDLSKLQTDYLKACFKTQIAMTGFSESCHTILENLPLIFTNLKKGKGKVALVFVESMVREALRLEKQVQELQLIFEDIQKAASSAAAKSGYRYAAEEDKKAKALRAWDSARREKAIAETLLKNIGDSIKKLDDLFNEAKATAEKMENRAFALEMVGAFMKPIGAALGVVGGIALRSQMPPDMSSLTPAKQPDKVAEGKPTDAGKPKETKEDPKVTEAKGKKDTADTEEKTAQTTYDKAKAKTLEKKAAVATCKKELTAAEEAYEKAESKDKPAARDKRTAAQTKLTAAEKEQDSAESEEAKEKTAYDAKQKAAETARNTYKTTLEALGKMGDVITDTGKDMVAAGKTFADLASRYHDEKMKYLDLLMEQKEQERKFIATIARFGNQMATIKADVEHLKIVLAALEVAKAALAKIVVILLTAVELWQNMARACQELGEKSTVQKGLIIIATEAGKKGIQEYFEDETNLKNIVWLYCRWKAVEVISIECGTNAKKVRSKVETNLQRKLSTPLMLQEATTKGRELNPAAEQAEGAVKNEIYLIEQAMLEPKPALPAPAR